MTLDIILIVWGLFAMVLNAIDGKIGWSFFNALFSVIMVAFLVMDIQASRWWL